MGVFAQFVPWLLPILLVLPVIAKEKNVVHLDLSPLRVGSGTDDPPQDEGIEIGDHSLVNDSKVYCTDSTFPNDIFCDLGKSKCPGSSNEQHLITDFFLKYPHPNASQIECFVGFGDSEVGPTATKLVYKSFACYNASHPDTKSQWLGSLAWKIELGEMAAVPDAELPENLQVGDFTVMEVKGVNPVNRALKCKTKYQNVGAGGGVNPSVAFQANTCACISTAPAYV